MRVCVYVRARVRARVCVYGACVSVRQREREREREREIINISQSGVIESPRSAISAEPYASFYVAKPVTEPISRCVRRLLLPGCQLVKQEKGPSLPLLDLCRCLLVSW